MDQFITNKDEINQRIKCIIESESLISVDEYDFGDYEKIIGYHSLVLIDESSEFNYSIDQDTVDITNKIIVNIGSDDALTLVFLERILSNIRAVFNSEIEIIYGHSNGLLNQKITIDIFLIKK